MLTPLAPSPERSVRAADGRALLLVDDDEVYRTIFGAVLEHAGFEIVMAADGAEALDLCARRTFALITLDVDMPGFNGWQTLAALRARGHDTPVIMVTGAVAPAQRIRGLEAGADDYL